MWPTALLQAYSYYNVRGVHTWAQLMGSALILAR